MLSLLVLLVFLFGYTIGQPNTDPVTAWLGGVATVIYYIVLVVGLNALKRKAAGRK